MEIHPSVQQDIGPLFGPLLKERYRLFKFYLDVLLHSCRQFSKLLEQELAIIRCADNAQNCWNDLNQKGKFKSIKRVFIILIMEIIRLNTFTLTIKSLHLSEYLLHVRNAFDTQRFENENYGLNDVVVMLLQGGIA